MTRREIRVPLDRNVGAELHPLNFTGGLQSKLIVDGVVDNIEMGQMDALMCIRDYDVEIVLREKFVPDYYQCVNAIPERVGFAEFTHPSATWFDKPPWDYVGAKSADEANWKRVTIK